MNIYLMRHAETNENLEGIVQGWNDTELTNNGAKQAQLIASQFNEDINAIICSDLKRCSQTAQPFVARHPDIPYIEDSRLRERNLGDAQGQHWSKEQWKLYWKNGEIDTPITGSETKEAFTGRLEEFLASLREERSSNSNVLIISHGGVINRMLEITGTNNQEDAFINTAITKIGLT